MKAFNDNRNAFPQEELAKYYGKHVAWSLDGKQILVSGNDDGEVIERVKAAGYNPGEVVLSYVPLPNEVCWGGLCWGVMEEVDH